MKKIQLTLLGGQTLPIYYIIAQQQPDIVYLIYTRQSKDMADRIANEVKSQFPKIICKYKETLPYEVTCTAEVCESIHCEEEGKENEFTYNLTGGTKPMAFGAFLTGEKHHAKLLYTDSKVILNLQTYDQEPLTCSLNFETIFRLQDQSLKEYQEYKKESEKALCAKNVEEIKSLHIRAWSKLRDAYKKKQIKIETSYYHRNTIYYIRDNKHIVITEEDGNEIFSSSYPKAYEQLFEGRWWETLVADAVAEWAAPHQYEVWCNVKFQPKENDKNQNDKNEVDILVNLGNTLLFIECKSGQITPKNIDTMLAVRKTYGGDKSKSVLVSYEHIDSKDEILTRADELGIDVIKPSKKKTTLELLSIQLDEIVKKLKV